MDEVRLTVADAGEVLTLQRAAYVSEAQRYDDPHLPPLIQTLDGVRDDLTGPALGLRDGARLVAAVRWQLEGDVAHIGRLVVAPDQQGRGLGTRLLRRAEALSGASQFALFTGARSTANIRLYEREGYVALPLRPAPEGVALIHLVKRR